MPGDELNADIGMMTAFSQQLSAPKMPPSLGRLAVPPNLTGLFEGIAMSLVDKAVTAEMTAVLTKFSVEMVTYTTKVAETAASYSMAEVATAATLVASTAKLAEQGVGLLKQTVGTLQSAMPGEAVSDKPSTDRPSGK